MRNTNIVAIKELLDYKGHLYLDFPFAFLFNLTNHMYWKRNLKIYRYNLYSSDFYSSIFCFISCTIHNLILENDFFNNDKLFSSIEEQQEYIRLVNNIENYNLYNFEKHSFDGIFDYLPFIKTFKDTSNKKMKSFVSNLGKELILVNEFYSKYKEKINKKNIRCKRKIFNQKLVQVKDNKISGYSFLFNKKMKYILSKLKKTFFCEYNFLSLTYKYRLYCLLYVYVYHCINTLTNNFLYYDYKEWLKDKEKYIKLHNLNDHYKFRKIRFKCKYRDIINLFNFRNSIIHFRFPLNKVDGELHLVNISEKEIDLVLKILDTFDFTNEDIKNDYSLSEECYRFTINFYLQNDNYVKHIENEVK